MHYFFLLTILIVMETFSTHARSADLDPIEIKIVSDVLRIEPHVKPEMNFSTLLFLNQQMHPQFNISFIPASRLREWRELETQPDVCLYNKVKNPAREPFAYFSQLPMTAFPPQRLVTSPSFNLPLTVNLEQAINDYGLLIGVIEGRSYGKHIDDFLMTHKEQFLWLAGKDSASRLREMLRKHKVDAVIEYSATFIDENSKDKTNFSFHQLYEAQESVLGFIACAKSPIGKKAITAYNRLLTQPQNQQYIIDAHKNASFGNEAQFIAAALTGLYRAKPAIK
ncbi:hypothetical protein [Pseudoalteromonas tunicata]|jgi:uncharacterized protein (TIGR02285 family)|nr:hypothetical protein [Pseudoalteromonas tunicata]ATC97003.1 hypothetical protein PTUN_b0656 [Pseudoalteromonas tunicata]AXT33123.1 ABC transporter substrate-binding protein [Pseudoalteromonas tunicata]MDP4984891.1 ABC transporter substrate-binding protein [Pseudoalteromonas tunicata]